MLQFIKKTFKDCSKKAKNVLSRINQNSKTPKLYKYSLDFNEQY